MYRCVLAWTAMHLLARTRLSGHQSQLPSQHQDREGGGEAAEQFDRLGRAARMDNACMVVAMGTRRIVVVRVARPNDDRSIGADDSQPRSIGG